MRQVVNIAENVLCVVAKLLQTELEHLEGHLLVLAAVVLHECSGDEHVVPAPLVLSRLLEHLAGRLDTLGPAGELHVLDVTLAREEEDRVHPNCIQNRHAPATNHVCRRKRRLVAS